MKTVIALPIGLLLLSHSAVADEATDYFNRGVQKAQKNDYRSAIADFTKAIDLKPGYAEAYNARGKARGALAAAPSDTGGSLADYNKAIELRPDVAEPYYNRAVLKQAKGDKVGALADQNKAIELQPDYAQAYANRGMIKGGEPRLHWSNVGLQQSH